VARDDDEPGDDRVALGLTAQELRPGELAGVLDERVGASGKRRRGARRRWGWRAR
jgi:hypothetical protein